MESPNTYRIIAGIALAITLIIAGDNYVFPVNSHSEIIENGTTDTRSKHTAYWLLTKEGGKYRVSGQVFNTTLIGDEIRIDRAMITGQPVQLGWCKNGHCYTTPISIVNNNYLSSFLLLLLIIYPLLVLTGLVKINTSGRSSWLYLYCTTVAGLLFFYFTY